MLADVITSDSSISLGLVVTLMLAAVAALTSAVTTRNKVGELEKDLEAHAVRIKELEKWQLSVTPLVAVLHERVSPGRGSGPLPQAGLKS